jgi:hypothetical protein
VVGVYTPFIEGYEGYSTCIWFARGRWLSGRKRQTVNLLGILALVRTQLFSTILKRTRLNKRAIDKVWTIKLLKVLDKKKLYKKNKNVKNYNFDWQSFNFQEYFNANHATFSALNVEAAEDYGYFDKHYTVKARFYRVWTWNAALLRWEHLKILKKLNQKGIKPVQKLFDFNDFFLSWGNVRSSWRRRKLLTRTPFTNFNSWLRTLLFFYRPTKMILHAKRDWLEFILLLNFKRFRFFPSIRSKKKPSFVTLSLGLFRRFTRRSRAWTKTRMSYLLSASFLRKVLMYTQFTNMFLFVNRIPKHLTAILHTIQSPALQLYEYPFLNFKRDKRTKKFAYSNGKMEFLVPEPGAALRRPTLETTTTYQVQFPFMVFTNSKAYAPTRNKKRGSIKRQNVKKIIMLNRISEYL